MGEANVRASLATSQQPPVPPVAMTEQPSGSAPARRTRETRIPFGNFEQKLAYPNREGYRRYWFNDEPGRIQKALEAGYEHVFDPIQKQNVSRVVGRNESGGSLTAFLMEIPQEWFEEDMAAYQKIIDEKEAGYKRGKVETAGADSQDVFRPEAQGRRIQISTPRKQ